MNTESHITKEASDVALKEIREQQTRIELVLYRMASRADGQPVHAAGKFVQDALNKRDNELITVKCDLDAAQREISGLRSQVACLERQLAESDEATKRAWREAGLPKG